MKTKLLSKLLIIIMVATAINENMTAQIGINTIAPITGGTTESLLAYNTYTSKGIGEWNLNCTIFLAHCCESHR